MYTKNVRVSTSQESTQWRSLYIEYLYIDYLYMGEESDGLLKYILLLMDD